MLWRRTARLRNIGISSRRLPLKMASCNTRVDRNDGGNSRIYHVWAPRGSEWLWWRIGINDVARANETLWERRDVSALRTAMWGGTEVVAADFAGRAAW